jgi:hypothetical protein
MSANGTSGQPRSLKPARRRSSVLAMADGAAGSWLHSSGQGRSEESMLNVLWCEINVVSSLLSKLII